jgi:hypothetical protein
MHNANFDLSELDSADEAEMEVMANGQPTGWLWKFAGPGHPQAIAQSNRISREQLAKQRAKEQTLANGKKWKSESQSPDEVRDSNVSFVIERLLGWSDITMGGEPYPFNQENARKLLVDRRKGALLQQALEFVFDDNSFTRRSATN